MGRRGNTYDNAKAESFMKTIKVEGAYPMVFETFTDVALSCRALSRRPTTCDAHSLLLTT